jgi:GT2 family glycosyltransferase
VAAPAVVATVLTRNRVELLRECVAAVLAQTRPVDGLIVVDNASTDGTLAMLAAEFPGVDVVALPENQGATGGFYEGVAAALRTRADWFWLLDDDSIARPTALEELMAGLDRLDGAAPPALLCSRVEWTDGNPHLMNRPVVRRHDPRDVTQALRRRLLPVRAATWVSLLVAREAVERVGLPPRHFFYQADDIEYTARMLRDARGYLVPDSVVEHRTPTQHTAVDDDHRFYYHARNNVLMLRGRAWRLHEKPVIVWWLAMSAIVYLRINRWAPRALRNLVAGVAAGLRRSATSSNP